MNAPVLAPLVFTTRNVFGVPKIYPVNAQARMLAQLVGKKTLAFRELRLAQELGLPIMAMGEVSPDLARFPRVEA
jgi:hypothetical protein